MGNRLNHESVAAPTKRKEQLIYTTDLYWEDRLTEMRANHKPLARLHFGEAPVGWQYHRLECAIDKAVLLANSSLSPSVNCVKSHTQE